MGPTMVRGGLMVTVVAAASIAGVLGSAPAASGATGQLGSPVESASVRPSAVMSAVSCKSCGRNLIVNPSAEAGVAGDGDRVVVPGWRQHGEFTVTSYSSPGGDVDASSPGPRHGGANYFYGGSSNARSWATQTIEIAKSGVRSGKVKYRLSAWLGGYATQADRTTLTASFRNAKGRQLAVAKVGPVTEADRQGVSGMARRKAKGLVPAKTRQVVVKLVMVRAEGSYNDGLADALSLVFKRRG